MADKNTPQTFKLSPKQRNLFISLNRSFDSMSPEEKQVRNDELKKILNTSQMINNAGLRDAFITKALGHSKYFNNYYKLKDMNPDFPIDSDYFKMLSDKDIKTKNVKSIEDIEEGFYDWNSPRHWSKLSQDEMKKLAQTMGMDDIERQDGKVVGEPGLKEFQDKVSKAQIDLDRQNLRSITNDPLAWLASQMFPRVAEAAMRGEDPSGKDWALDAGENALYAFNPFGKGLGAGARIAANAEKKGAAKVLSLLGKTADVAANPVIMEFADAAAYDENESPNRARASVMDMVYGTGMNQLLGRTVPNAVKSIKKEVPKEMVSTETAKQMQKLQKVAPKNTLEDKQMKKVIKEQELKDKAAKMTPEERKEFLQTMKERTKLQSELTKASKETREATPKEIVYSQLATENPKQWVIDWTTNKTGDLLGENPKIRNRAVRQIPGMRFAYPFLAEQETEQQKADREAREKVNELLGSM